ncbi:hypothetical protein BOSE62_80192 [Bosea sp. 62]|nr:hypothetical protein BOSE7B_140061 [Bosea sp. 7B]CAD5272340.1 hypothetical protein BOSE21B_20114 [Bosea sp. 21B]CAD5274590.1 hypothetical protein BOSE46_20408 [Bosea sp. 46]VVT59271.1 hypothetical protein BOS5A_210062 [Bosea sp. EC-HK365B]VXC25640.1 hypothetical protein BOSE127_170614 [Bosea sp. 127]VXC42406.1 hypothetical protein BOSE29B_30950 [Bosea sp. 29B]VXC66866.1 hypothetical protein BOSE125_30555 [Bosea sp. 125]VXC97306.1 hypothetical protein BOSE62_80192 [Bosea sp. 62]
MRTMISAAAAMISPRIGLGFVTSAVAVRVGFLALRALMPCLARPRLSRSRTPAEGPFRDGTQAFVTIAPRRTDQGDPSNVRFRATRATGADLLSVINRDRPGAAHHCPKPIGLLPRRSSVPAVSLRTGSSAVSSAARSRARR